MPNNVTYNICKYQLASLGIDYINDDIKVILVNGYTPDIDNHNYYSNVSAYEINGYGYTSGGILLTNKTITRDDLNDRTKYDADNISLLDTVLICTGAITYKDTGVTSTSPLICYTDFGGTKDTNHTQFQIIWNDDEGILYLK